MNLKYPNWEKLGETGRNWETSALFLHVCMCDQEVKLKTTDNNKNLGQELTSGQLRMIVSMCVYVTEVSKYHIWMDA